MLWRLLDMGDGSGAWNMAVDEALLLACDEKPHITLRFYQWEKPTLSLGHFQEITDIDLKECTRRGFEWVRRPTGGRAVLHQYELTYSFVAPIALLGESVSRSHASISRALALGLQKLGLKADFAPVGRGTQPCAPTAACFAAPAFVELAVGGKKVIGSAQTRTRFSMLQHGSIPLKIDSEVLAAVLKLHEPATLRWLRQKTAGLTDFLEREPTLAELKSAILQGFEEFFKQRFVPGDLTETERVLAEKLSEKYATRQNF